MRLFKPEAPPRSNFNGTKDGSNDVAITFTTSTTVAKDIAVAIEVTGYTKGVAVWRSTKTWHKANEIDPQKIIDPALVAVLDLLPESTSITLLCPPGPSAARLRLLANEAKSSRSRLGAMLHIRKVTVLNIGTQQTPLLKRLAILSQDTVDRRLPPTDHFKQRD